MANHSSILAWRIPWAEEPDGLQPMGQESWALEGNRRVRDFWGMHERSQVPFRTNSFCLKQVQDSIIVYLASISGDKTAGSLLTIHYKILS